MRLLASALVLVVALWPVSRGRANAELQWDGEIQSPAWRHRLQLELQQASAHAAVAAQTTGTSGPLKPCPTMVATPPLPEQLPTELVAMVKEVETALDQMFMESGATGGIGVLVYGDQVLTTHGWGKSSAEGSTPGGDTIFRIGSISKVFTDLLLYRLDEEGAASSASLFTPITSLAPEYNPSWPVCTWAACCRA
eukprot:SAG31_NODE_5083_length_2754_cov_1.407533_2_plen_195_part_00